MRWVATSEHQNLSSNDPSYKALCHPSCRLRLLLTPLLPLRARLGINGSKSLLARPVNRLSICRRTGCETEKSRIHMYGFVKLRKSVFPAPTAEQWPRMTPKLNIVAICPTRQPMAPTRMPVPQPSSWTVQTLVAQETGPNLENILSQ